MFVQILDRVSYSFKNETYSYLLSMYVYIEQMLMLWT